MLLCIFYTSLAVLGLASSAFALSSCGCGGLSVPVRAELRAVRHTSKTDALAIDGCPGHVSWKDAPFPNALEPEEPSRVHWLRSLFTQQEVASVVRLLSPAAFSAAADSTDHLPAFELYLLGGGKPAAGEPGDAGRLEAVRSLVLPRIEACVTPFVRKKFGCAECLPCISLARRYTPSERTLVRPHRDALARVTVVVELQPADGSSPAAAAKAGGLFIQKSEDSDVSMVPMRAGDAFLHDYSLLHGVKLSCETCTRYSLVVWYREDGERCAAGGGVESATRMYRRSARAGVPEGLYTWARHALQIGFDGKYAVGANALAVVRSEPNASNADATFIVREALDFLSRAVTEHVHGDACVFLAELHLKGVPGALEPDATTAERYRQRARGMGGSELAAWEKTRGEELDRALQEQHPRGVAAGDAAGAAKVCLYQFDDRADDALGSQIKLTELNRQRCEADPACIRHTFQRTTATGIPPWWSKVHLVREQLQSAPDCDVVAWLDTDAVVNAAPSAIAARLGSASMLISRDLPIYGDCAAATCGDDDFNAGVWAVRNSVAGRKLMDAWWVLFRADAWSKKDNGKWVCVDTDEATGNSEPCEWGQGMFEQGAFVRHVLPRHRAEIRQATWMVLNNPCATTELIDVATTCHFMQDLRHFIPVYLDGPDAVRGFPAGGRAREMAAGDLQGLRRIIDVLGAWKEHFGAQFRVALREAALPDTGSKAFHGCSIDMCGGSDEQVEQCVRVCEQYRLRECAKYIGESAAQAQFFEANTEARRPKLHFLLISPATPSAVFARHGIERVHAFGKDDSAEYSLEGPRALTHTGKGKGTLYAARCRHARRVALQPSEVTLVRLHNATATFEGFVVDASGAVLSVEPRYTLTLLAELLKLPTAYRLSRRCGGGAGTDSVADSGLATCCIAASSDALATLSLLPLLHARGSATDSSHAIGAHESAFYDELDVFSSQLMRCSTGSGGKGGRGHLASASLTHVARLLVWQPLFANNFYHFVVNGLPRLLRLLPWLRERPAVRLYFGAGEQPFSRDFFEALQLTDRVLPYDPCRVYRAEQLYVSLASGSVLPSRALAAQMRDTMLHMSPAAEVLSAPSLAVVRRPVIFIDRSDATPRALPGGRFGVPRSVHNMACPRCERAHRRTHDTRPSPTASKPLAALSLAALSLAALSLAALSLAALTLCPSQDEAFGAVRELLAASAFDPVRLKAASVPLHEQVALMSKARVLIGSHGAGNALALALPADGALLELVPGLFEMPNDLQDDALSTQCGFTPYWYLTAVRGLKYHALLVHDYSWDDAHVVPTRPLTRALTSLLSETAAVRGESGPLDAPGSDVAHTEVTKVLQQGGARIDQTAPIQVAVEARGGGGGTPLHAAAQRDDVSALKTLLARSPLDVDVLDARGLTPLHVAAVRGHAAAARQLLQQRASATRRDAQGMTPLHLAALGGSIEVARLLLQHGASLDAVEPVHESTALHIAAARPRRDCDIAGVLLDGGASLDLTDGEGRTPYRIALDLENAPCVELFRGWQLKPSLQEAEASARPQEEKKQQQDRQPQPQQQRQAIQVAVKAGSGSGGAGPVFVIGTLEEAANVGAALGLDVVRSPPVYTEVCPGDAEEAVRFPAIALRSKHVRGCTLAHRQVWSAARGAPRALVFEGDAVPSSGRSRAVALRALAAGRDVEYLGWCYDDEPGSPPLCSHAYALSQRAIDELLSYVPADACEADGTSLWPVDHLLRMCVRDRGLSWAKEPEPPDAPLHVTSGAFHQADGHAARDT